MAFPPQAFLIGAQKAGTTSLAELLDQHPGIVVSNPKEPDFFTRHWDLGLKWYERCFTRTQGVLLDASVSYTMAPHREWLLNREHEVPRRIHEVSPTAKFIYVVRDPADRCFSAYWHEVRARGEKRSLRETVEQGAYFTMGSYYFRQISRFLRYFPLDRFLILQFDEVIGSPATTASRCVDFLQAGDDAFVFKVGRPRNQGFLYNRGGEVLRGLLGRERFNHMSKAASKLLPVGARGLVKPMIAKGLPKLNENDRAWLYAKFAEDMRNFEHLAGLTLRSKRNMGEQDRSKVVR